MFIAVLEKTEMFQCVQGREILMPLAEPVAEGDVLVLDPIEVDERQVSGYLQVQYVVKMTLIRLTDGNEEQIYIRETCLQRLIDDWKKKANVTELPKRAANAA